MADSLRDYFIRFLFKNEGVDKLRSSVAGIEQGLDRAGRKAFAFNEKLQAVKHVLEPFRLLGEMVNRTAEEADALKDLAERTGIATDELEKYAYVAKLSGASTEALTTGLRVLEKNMGEAAQGSKTQVETFAKLGIRIHDTNGKLKTTQQLLPDVAKAFEKLPSHAQKTAYAMQLFGRAGQELLPMLAKGADKIREMQEELELLGGVTSEKFLAAADEYGDNINRLSAAWKGVRQAISGPIVEAINKIAAGFLTWWKVAGALVRSKIEEWSQQLVTSLQALWITVTKLAAPLLLFAAALNVPLLAMIALKLMLALLIDDFANWVAGNDSIIGRVIKNWDAWLDKIAETNPMLATVLATFGDLVKFVANSIEVISFGWEQLIKTISDGSFVDGVKAMFSALADFITAPILSAVDTIKTSIFDMLLYVKGVAKSLGLEELSTSLGNAAGSFIRPNVDQRISPPIAGNTMTSNQSSNTTEVGINVVAAPGMNERALAEEIKKQFNMEMDSQLRGAYNVTVPEAY